MQILIVGTGYVGLVTGACFAEMGHTVHCLDIDAEKIKKIQAGILPIYEPGLEEIVKRNVHEGRLLFCSQYPSALTIPVYFIAVPTPSKPDGSCDVSYVDAAAQSIGRHITTDCIVVNKSTVPVGTADRVETIITKILKERSAHYTLDVVSNPEFLKEGAAVQDCLKPDRVVIGARTKKAAETVKALYSSFTLNHDCIILMDTRSAEMTKYAANAMLATRISFMNEIANLCKKTGANINEVRKGIGSDSRIGYSFLYAGVGYGGSCFPKDIRALISLAKEVGENPLLLEAVEAINHMQKKLLVKKMDRYFAKRGGLSGKTIAIWGLSFKPDTDDMREAPSLEIITSLINAGAFVRLFDPVAMTNAQKILEPHPHITWCTNEIETAHHADAIALLTEWKQFRLVDFDPILQHMKGIAFFDGRNQYKHPEMKKKGFDYISIGVPDQLHEC